MALEWVWAAVPVMSVLCHDAALVRDVGGRVRDKRQVMERMKEKEWAQKVHYPF